MSEKIFKVVSILFLSSIFVLSCSNKDKTGDGTQTVQGIAKYAGTWTAQFGVNKSYNVIIDTDGSVKIKDEAGETKAENVQGSGNTYTMTVQHGSNVDPSNIIITFESDNSGNITDVDFGSGTITKNN